MAPLVIEPSDHMTTPSPATAMPPTGCLLPITASATATAITAAITPRTENRTRDSRIGRDLGTAFIVGPATAGRPIGATAAPAGLVNERGNEGHWLPGVPNRSQSSRRLARARSTIR